MISWLREWVTLIIYNVIFITVVEIILPDNSLKKYCKFVLGLILISVLINPVIKAVSNKDLVKEIESKEYLINDNYVKFDVNSLKDIDSNRVAEVFNEKLGESCEKFLTEKFPDVDFKVAVKSSMDKKENKVQISSVSVTYNNKKNIKSVENIKINNKENNDDNFAKDELKGKIITTLCEELKITRNKITAKESGEVNDERN